MSITFWCPAESEVILSRYKCDCHHGEGGGGGGGDPSCYWCQGSGVVEIKGTEHEVNMANGNAMALLRLVDPERGEEEEYWGEFTTERLPSVIRHTIRALNLRRIACKEVIETVETTGCYGATLIQVGRGEEYITERLRQLLALFQQAQQLQSSVVWG